jgi:hypothetical protein
VIFGEALPFVCAVRCALSPEDDASSPVVTGEEGFSFVPPPYIFQSVNHQRSHAAGVNDQDDGLDAYIHLDADKSEGKDGEADEEQGGRGLGGMADIARERRLCSVDERERRVVAALQHAHELVSGLESNDRRKSDSCRCCSLRPRQGTFACHLGRQPNISLTHPGYVTPSFEDITAFICGGYAGPAGKRKRGGVGRPRLATQTAIPPTKSCSHYCAEFFFVCASKNKEKMKEKGKRRSKERSRLAKATRLGCWRGWLRGYSPAIWVPG